MKIANNISLLLLFLLIFSLNPPVSARASISEQVDPNVEKANQLLANMSPEERVGQLFLVSFRGAAAGTDSQINDLIINHHVGGVMLLAENDNFTAMPTTDVDAYNLISQLQNAEWNSSQAAPTPDNPGTATPTTGIPASLPNYIPLFIGISQAGDGYPNDQILDGLTSLPSLMAVGATWDSTLAKQVGLVAGQELSSLGFNFFAGPSLDVLESPQATLGNGLSVNVFGGDPYWVGLMGSSYISGLHAGSQNRMVVITDHFPGRGSADRPAGQEPATVRKGLEELKKIELAPFFSVTGDAEDTSSRTDGLLVSHIRYQGFQGNIRSTTRPVSFDPQALSQILALPEFASWRNAGGLVVSDDLGSPTVRSFYDPGKQSFLARLVARDAFLAGNDLLYMGNILSSDASDNYSSVVQTIDFFVQKYNEDSAFQKSVDDAVRRILTVKYRLYNNFDLDNVIPSATGLTLLNRSESQAVTSEVARQSATLVSPDILDLETVLPNPPGINDHLVFITDTRTVSQCSTCLANSMLPVDALQNVVLRLYGPKSGGQVMPGRLISYSLDSIGAILPGGSGNDELQASLQGANWVIINMLDAEPGQQQTVLLRRFLSERQDLLRDKHVIVFAFNAPYYLDATDISKVTAYYCLYGKSAPFVEVAARLLFRELAPSGILPVSVAGIGYDLLTATSPDPSQIITLSIDLPISSTPSVATGTEEPTFTPSFSVGETISVHTGIILDHNKHPVPDGTGVQFTIEMSGNAGVFQQLDAVTTGGVASAPFNIAKAGLLEIRATSDPALTSNTLRLDVTSGEITISTPTEVNLPTPTPTITPIETATPVAPPQKSSPGMAGWFSMVVLLGGLGYLAYWLGNKFMSRRWGIRWANCVIAGGLLAYTYLAIRFPGAAGFLKSNGWSGTMAAVLTGALLGASGAFIWLRAANGSKKQSG
jgi:beta-N-acetylhexosaminidase